MDPASFYAPQGQIRADANVSIRSSIHKVSLKPFAVWKRQVEVRRRVNTAQHAVYDLHITAEIKIVILQCLSLRIPEPVCAVGIKRQPQLLRHRVLLPVFADSGKSDKQAEKYDQ